MITIKSQKIILQEYFWS